MSITTFSPGEDDDPPSDIDVEDTPQEVLDQDFLHYARAETIARLRDRLASGTDITQEEAD